jgi:uncharacterized protein YggE
MKYFCAVVVIWAGMSSGLLAETDQVITTTGQGKVETAPDMATISLGVTHEAKRADSALALTSDAVREVLSRLEQAGIAQNDIQTNSLSLQPVWSRPTSGTNAPARITGFVARNSLSVRVRDLDKLGGVLDLVVQEGANTFDGLQFSLQDPEPTMAAARADAVRDAMARAQQLAEAAGVTLGPVQSISENTGSVRPQMMEMAAARMASDVPVAEGEISLSAQVSMVFAIAE